MKQVEAEASRATQDGLAQTPDAFARAPDVGVWVLNRATRLTALRRSRLLAPEPVEAFDRVARLAARLLDTPIACVSLVEPHRQVLKSLVGPADVRYASEAARHQMPLSHSFCKYVVEREAPLAIADARNHPLVKDGPVVPDLGVIAYLGVPFRASAPADEADGAASEVLGALCVLDYEARAWSEADEHALADLAALLTDELRFREAARRAEEAELAHAAVRALTEASFDAIADLFVILDRDGTLARWNGRMTAVTGYTDDELAGMSVLTLFTEDTRPTVSDMVARVYAEGQASVEATFLTKTGHRIPYELNGRPLRDGDGRVIGLCGTARDITERRRAAAALAEHAQALQAANDRFEALVENVPGIVYQCLYEHDGTFSFPFIGDGIGRDVGLDLTVLREHPERLYDLIHPADLDGFHASLRASWSGAEPWSWEGRAVIGNEVHWISAAARPTRLGDGRLLWNGILTVVTAQKQTEEALRVSETRHRGLLEATPDLFFRLSGEGRYLDVKAPNPVLLASDVSNLLGRTIPEVLPAETAARWLEVIGEALATGQLRQQEYELTTQDGQRRYFEARVVPVGADEVQAIVRDVTERRQAEEALVAAKEAAEEAARLKGALLTNMSHEIRTPLTGIIGFADILAEEAAASDSDGEQETFLRLIGENGRRLLETLNSVLDLAQIEAGRRQPARAAFDLREAVAETGAVFRARAEAKGLTFTVAHPPDPVVVETDRGALSRILTNLVSNAVKYTEAGSVTVSLEAFPDEVVVHVADTGIGISEAFRPLLFEAFRQESEGEARRYEGNGLGLAITKGLAEVIGGRISVESVRGAGSTFTLHLPVRA